VNITILICTYNGKNKLQETLKRISQLIIPKELNLIELLIVDNNSNDETSNFVSNYWLQLNTNVNLNIIYEKKAGKANALTTGYNKAKGDLVLLCDDDNWLNSNYLEHAYQIFKTYDEVGLAGGYGVSAIFPEERKPEWFDRFQFYYVIGKHHKNSGFLKSRVYSICGAGSIIRKSVWDNLYSAGFRFHNSMSFGKAITEDVELSMGVTFSGFKLYFDEKLTFIHDLRWGRMEFDSLIQQEKMNGKGNVILIVYQLIYDLISINKLNRITFLKCYVKQLIIRIKELKTIQKNYIINKDIVIEVELSKKKSVVLFMIKKLPRILIEYSNIRNWIMNISFQESKKTKAYQ
jgi:glycosyltransferase involved in cell wall biosynthesis